MLRWRGGDDPQAATPWRGRLVMAWSNSSTEVIEMASGCRLAAPRLLPDGAGNCDVLEGRAKGWLVKNGERNACSKGRAFLLRLKTGQRGRPQERIILPPKPAPRKSSASRPEGGARKTATNARPKILREETPNTPDMADAVAVMQRQIRQVTEAMGKLEREIRVIQAARTDKSDLEEKVTRLGAMVETMRRTWREAHDYTPHHPELPPISQPILSIPVGACR